MASNKRKRAQWLENEVILGQAEETAFQAAFFVLDDADDVSNSPPPAAKKRRTQARSNDESSAMATTNRVIPRDIASSDLVVQERATVAKRTTSSDNDDTSNDKQLFVLDRTGSMLNNDACSTSMKNHDLNRSSKRQAVTAPTTSDAAAAKLMIRIQLLVARHAPLDMYHLPRLYQESFHECLDFKSLGFDKLNAFVETIPLIDMHSIARDVWILFLSTQQDKVDVAVANARNETNANDTNVRDSTVEEEAEESMLDSLCVDDNDSLSAKDSEEEDNQEPPLVSEDAFVDKNKATLSVNGSHGDEFNQEVLLDSTDAFDNDEAPGANNNRTDESFAESTCQELVVSCTDVEVASCTDAEVTSKAVHASTLDETECVASKDTAHKPTEPLFVLDSTGAVCEFTLKARVSSLVAREEPLLLCSLPRRYHDFHGTDLDYKPRGYGKLKHFVETIDSVKVEFVGGDWVLFSQSDDIQEQTENEEDTISPNEHNEANLKDAHNGDQEDDPPLYSSSAQSQELAVDGTITQALTVTEAAKSKVCNRVQILVARNAPLNLSDLSQLYQDSFGELLDYKSHGFGKLKIFVRSIAGINMQQTGSNWILTSDALSVSLIARVGPIVESGKRFGCLGCGERQTVWGLLKNHMQDCCPANLKIPKLQQKCRLGHKRCAVPNQDTTSTSNSEVGVEVEKLYGCLGCGDLQGEWAPCLQHMAECCADRIVDCASNAFQRRCTIGDEMCDVPGHEQGEKLRYGCPDCGELQLSWAQCLQHMQGCCSLLLENRDGLLWKCRIGDERCEVPGHSNVTSSRATLYEMGMDAGVDDENRHSQTVSSNAMNSDEPEKSRHGSTNDSLIVVESDVDEDASPYDVEVSKLKRLVTIHQPVLLTKLPVLYREMYKERLYIRSLGFPSLESFVETIPSIKVSLSVARKENSTRILSMQNESERSEAKYGCLRCGKRYEQWAKCLLHLKECCPEEHGKLNHGRKKVRQKCSIGHRCCAVPGVKTR